MITLATPHMERSMVIDSVTGESKEVWEPQRWQLAYFFPRFGRRGPSLAAWRVLLSGPASATHSLCRSLYRRHAGPDPDEHADLPEPLAVPAGDEAGGAHRAAGAAAGRARGGHAGAHARGGVPFWWGRSPDARSRRPAPPPPRPASRPRQVLRYGLGQKCVSQQRQVAQPLPLTSYFVLSFVPVRSFPPPVSRTTQPKQPKPRRYDAHHDVGELDSASGALLAADGGQRVATALLYLTDGAFVCVKGRSNNNSATAPCCFAPDPRRFPSLPVPPHAVEEGGETAFPDSRWADPALSPGPWSACADGGVAARARVGQALIFVRPPPTPPPHHPSRPSRGAWVAARSGPATPDASSVPLTAPQWSITPDNEIDPASMHAGCPVIKGTKARRRARRAGGRGRGAAGPFSLSKPHTPHARALAHTSGRPPRRGAPAGAAGPATTPRGRALKALPPPCCCSAVPQWIHAKPFRWSTPPPPADPNACEDSNAACRMWAKEGECEVRALEGGRGKGCKGCGTSFPRLSRSLSLAAARN